jgi:hypothetical protein
VQARPFFGYIKNMIDRTGTLGAEELDELWQMGLVENPEMIEFIIRQGLAKAPGVRLKRVETEPWRDLPFSDDPESEDIRVSVTVETSSRPAKDFQKQWIISTDNPTHIRLVTRQAVELMLQQIARAEKWPV